MKAGDRQEKLLRLLLHAYPDRVTLRRLNDPTRGLMVGGRGVQLEGSSVVRAAPLFLSLDPRDVPGAPEARVSLASAIREEWLEEVHPHLLKRALVHRYETDRDRVASLRQTWFSDLLIREDPVDGRGDATGVAAALHAALSPRAQELFLGDEKAGPYLRRVRFLRRAMPELNLPDLAPEELGELLGPACEGARSLEEVRRRGLRGALEGALEWSQRRQLDEHAPEAYPVPSGSRIRIDYDGDSPVLAVRLQELFGLAETPRLAGGRVPVVLQLLGPNYRPVQVTSDLRSFWNGTYQEVRKELRARYPKHPWPEDPWNAPAVNVGGRKRR